MIPDQYLQQDWWQDDQEIDTNLGKYFLTQNQLFEVENDKKFLVEFFFSYLYIQISIFLLFLIDSDTGTAESNLEIQIAQLDDQCRETWNSEDNEFVMCK